MTASASLGEICQFMGGGTPSRKIKRYWNGDIPWATVKDLKSDRISRTLESISRDGLENSASKVVPSGTVLLVTRVGLGKVAIADIDIAINQDIKAVLPSKDVLPEFLLWALKNLGPTIKERGTGATVKGVTLRDIKEMQIPLPSLKEQKRIVDILNRAATIELLRTEAARRLREFIPALFVKMFGHPATNPMEWHTDNLGSLGTLNRGRSRHRPRNAPQLYGGPYPFLQTGDIANSNGLVTQYSQTYSEAGLSQSKMWPSGTLCITIAANIAMTGVLTFDSCFPDSIVGFRPRNTVTIEYIQTAVDLMQKQLEEYAPRAAQRNINLGVLRKLTIPTPPVALQRRYAEIVDQARAVVCVRESGRKTATALTTSLMSKLLRSDA